MALLEDLSVMYGTLELEIAVLIKMNEIRKKYFVTPFFVDQLCFHLTSFRHYNPHHALVFSHH
jgi:hypothetical protein